MPIQFKGPAIAQSSREEAAAGEEFLDILQRDADVRRRYLEAGHDEIAVAKLIAEQTGKHITPENLLGITKHLTMNKAAQCGRLATAYPAMNFVVTVQH